MTEAEWLACDDPIAMLRLRGQQLSDRKLRLFACACCRRIWHLLPHETTRQAVEVAERFADKEASPEALAAGRAAAEAAEQAARPGWDGIRLHASNAAVGATWDTAWTSSPYAFQLARRYGGDVDQPAGWLAVAWTVEMAADAGARAAAGRLPVPVEAEAAERRALAELLRDIVGNPFRPITINPMWRAWKDRTVVKMAQHIYDGRDFSLLPILCDALEEAGCGDEDIITHCRLETVHTRGCWVVDLLLGKE